MNNVGLEKSTKHKRIRLFQLIYSVLVFYEIFTTRSCTTCTYSYIIFIFVRDVGFTTLLHRIPLKWVIEARPFCLHWSQVLHENRQVVRLLGSRFLDIFIWFQPKSFWTKYYWIGKTKYLDQIEVDVERLI